MIYAVIDTNVMVSAMLTHNKQSATFQVMEAMFANQMPYSSHTREIGSKQARKSLKAG